jgi:hypothetical protein
VPESGHPAHDELLRPGQRMENAERFRPIWMLTTDDV